MSMIEIKAPAVGESITEVVIGEWVKSVGEWVEEDETIVIVESDKVNMEVPAPQGGVLSAQLKAVGDVAQVGELIAHLDPNARPSVTPASTEPIPTAPIPTAPIPTGPTPQTSTSTPAAPGSASAHEPRVTPAARRILAERGLSASEVTATGPGGRLLKEDALNHRSTPSAPTPPSSAPAPTAPKPTAPKPTAPVRVAGARESEKIKMSPIRKTVARRLLEAQQTAAILTTFNEVDMSAVMALRARYKEPFLKRHHIKLGFMSFFVRAVIEALKQYPAVNAKIEGDSIVYHHYYDIGVAIGGGKGLVVPVIRNAESLGFAEIEASISDFGQRAQKNRIKLEELQGGTFSITNGGIYGSLLSTPILNPPQSGILGMHGIQERPIALSGEVVIRPMMYIALSYDHRIVDGKGAVSFLKLVKELVEDPQRILLEI
jgi:2-oxoglutarate dehydrogenase E2 component (dihydrolipoamide succinyltransferase)